MDNAKLRIESRPINLTILSMVCALDGMPWTAFWTMEMSLVVNEMGWNGETGVPTADKLAELGISWVGDELSELSAAPA